jgi:hypothetical protein
MVTPDPRHPRRSQAEIPLIDLSEFRQPPLSPGPRGGGGNFALPNFADFTIVVPPFP